MDMKKTWGVKSKCPQHIQKGQVYLKAQYCSTGLGNTCISYFWLCPILAWLILPTPNQIGPAPNCICESTELPLMKMKLGFSDFCTQSHTQVCFCHSRTQHHLSHEHSHSCILVDISPAA